jgi:hypothetical protein
MAWTTTFLVVSILVLLAVAYTAGQTWNLRLRRQRRHLRDRTATTGPEAPADRPADAGGHQGSFTRPSPTE